jgi:hypothetical protein
VCVFGAFLSDRLCFSSGLDVEIRKDWLDCCNTSLAVVPLPPDESPDMHFEDDSPYPLDGEVTLQSAGGRATSRRF